MNPAWKDGSVLVTGGAGFIGGHVAARLLADGREVICLDAFTSDLYEVGPKEETASELARSPRFHLVRGDVCDERLIDNILATRRVRHVVHLAARPGVRASFEAPIAYEQVNVRGTLVLLEAVRRHGIESCVYGSSSSIYGATSRAPFREDDAAGLPMSPYAATKRTAEHFCQVYAHLFGIPIICLRFFTVYGPRNRPDMAAYRFVMSLLREEPLNVYGDGSARRDFTYVDDTVEGVMAALRWKGTFDIVNLGNSRAVPISELISLLEARTGRRARLNRLPAQPGDVPLTCADTTHAERVLGFHARIPLEAGLERLVAWATSKAASAAETKATSG